VCRCVIFLILRPRCAGLGRTCAHAVRAFGREADSVRPVRSCIHCSSSRPSCTRTRTRVIDKRAHHRCSSVNKVAQPIAPKLVFACTFESQTGTSAVRIIPSACARYVCAACRPRRAAGPGQSPAPASWCAAPWWEDHLHQHVNPVWGRGRGCGGEPNGLAPVDEAYTLAWMWWARRCRGSQPTHSCHATGRNSRLANSRRGAAITLRRRVMHG